MIKIGTRIKNWLILGIQIFREFRWPDPEGDGNFSVVICPKCGYDDAIALYNDRPPQIVQINVVHRHLHPNCDYTFT